jgi:exonuclease III
VLLVWRCLLQETKLQESHVADVVQQVGLQDWHVTFNCSTAKKGYSGTATLCRWVGKQLWVRRGAHALLLLLAGKRFLSTMLGGFGGCCLLRRVWPLICVQAEAAQREVWHWVSGA